MSIALFAEGFGFLVLVVGVVAGVVAYYRTQQSKATIQILQETVDAQRDRNTEYQLQVTDLQGQIETLRTKHTALQNENQALSRLVTGREAIEQFTVMLTKHMRDVEQINELITARDEKMINIMVAIQKDLERRRREYGPGGRQPD